MPDTGGELSKRLHLLGTHELVLQLFAGADVHERSDELQCLARPVPDDVGALEQIEIGTVAVAEAVFGGPVIGVGGKRVTSAGGGTSAVLGMKLFLPESDVVRRGGGGVTEQGLEALRPGQFAGSYSPNPNSIIRSLGSERKMLRDFRRAARYVCRTFIGLVVVGLFAGYIVSLNFGR